MTQQYSRTRVVDQILRSPGPYEAIIVNHLDRTYTGTLEVELVKYDSAGNFPRRSGQLIQARYLSPFYGVTPAQGLTANDGYERTQKSYGFWAIPPDVGTRVLVIFVEGNISNAYWIGCVQDRFMNFMVPDGRPCTRNTTQATPSELANLKLPVGEYNKNFENGDAVNPAYFPRPYNKDFTAILEVQGTLIDEARGTTTTSAVREIPSMVFGMSTPGPLDKRNTHPTAEYGPEQSLIELPFNRLGGSSFVMDDGDDKFVRATHASDGPPIYINKEDGEEGGDETIPQNELIRFRTRTGHQIVMHNSEDFIYIANSRGTAWIELTSDGKIDIYAQDSISLFTENDFNVHAMRDINMEAGRNINMRASAQWSDLQSHKNGKRSGQIHIESYFGTNVTAGAGGGALSLNTSRDWNLKVDGEIKIEASSNVSLLSGANIMITANESIHEFASNNVFRKAGVDLIDQSNNHYTQVGSNLNVTVGENSRESVGANKDLSVDGVLRLGTQGALNISAQGSIYQSAKGDLQMSSDGNLNLESRGGTLDLLSSGSMNLESSATMHMLANGTFIQSNSEGNFLAASDLNLEGGAQVSILASADVGIDGSNVHLNSGVAGAANVASPAFSAALPSAPNSASVGVSGNTPNTAEPTHRIGKLPTITLPFVMPGDNNFAPLPLETIVPRAPQHEPWPHHENLDPLAFKPEQTDREEPGQLISGSAPASGGSPGSVPDVPAAFDPTNDFSDAERLAGLGRQTSGRTPQTLPIGSTGTGQSIGPGSA
jgi:uncharacterized protein (DUF2345 family)